jgi:hypothetical protein
MLQKCANPACSVPFRSLREGKLFLAENRDSRAEASGASSVRKLRREHFWLCESCSSHFTLRFDNDRGMMTVPLAEKSLARFQVAGSGEVLISERS